MTSNQIARVAQWFRMTPMNGYFVKIEIHSDESAWVQIQTEPQKVSKKKNYNSRWTPGSHDPGVARPPLECQALA